MTVRKQVKSFPDYKIHKSSGRAYVWWNSKRHYLGHANSPESFEAYNRFIAEIAQSQGQIKPEEPTVDSTKRWPTISELMVVFLPIVKKQVCPNEFDNTRYSLRELRKLYGHTPVDQFGPKSLKLVRQAIIETGVCRNTINQRLVRIKRMFKWGVAEELVPPSIFHALQTVAGLRRGENGVKETDGVKPVPAPDREQLIPFLSPCVAAMVQVQYLTGMRPGEVCRMKLCDIDRRSEIWIYQPDSHKNQWRGKERMIPIGPQAQKILEPYLEHPPEEPLFSPAKSALWQRQRYLESIAKNRKTPIYPSEEAQKTKRRLKRQQLCSTCPAQRRPGKKYTSNTYRNAILNGIKRASKEGVSISPWSPNQLRHSRATDIRRTHGLEAAQVILGHAHADVTQIYAERDIQKAIEIAKESG